jgi:indolepyruvate ferredoxin oxidoreductase, alpha subunit
MAERSFAKEIESLKLGDGGKFEGEGILAVAKAALQAGVSYVGGYPGSPVSQLIDVLSQAEDIRDEYGIHLEICATEAGAAARLGASINYPVRGLAVWKSVAGTNVASDALTYLSSPGVTGGAVIVIGEDYGEGAAAVQERSHAFAMKSSMWLLDPRPNLTSIVDAVEKAFDLSEASNTPVMVMLRILACHVQGSFTAKDNKKPTYSRHNKFKHSVRDYGRIPGGPSLFVQEKAKVDDRLPAAKKYIVEHGMNETFEGDLKQIGIITQGGLFNSVLRALERVGLADAYGAARVPIHVLNVAHPLIDDQLVEFCSGKQRVLMVEEGHPDYIEQSLNSILRKADLQTIVHGKDILPMAGQYTPEVLKTGFSRFVEMASIEALDTTPFAALPENAMSLQSMADTYLPEPIPPRPPTFCTGCPERPIFSAIKLVEEQMGKTYISCDIGCLTYSTLPPFNFSNSLASFGLSLAYSSGMAPMFDKRVISIMGDGGFWHNGLSSGVASAVFNQDDSILIIVNNGYISATGWQPLPSSPKDGVYEDAPISIQRTLQGLGVTWLHTVRTYDVAKMMKTLKEAMTTTTGGLKVIVAESECMLAKQRRVRAQRNERLKTGRRDVRPRFCIDDDVCTGDHSCIRLSGCPSLTIKPSTDILRSDPVAHVNKDCVGCGLCGELAHAAVLCPSYFKVEIISNPSFVERMLTKLRRAVIALLYTPEPKEKYV